MILRRNTKPEPLYKPFVKMLGLIVGVFVEAGLLYLVGGYLLGHIHYPLPARINITRAQYENAYADWRALHIEEYEITTDTQAFLGGVTTLHVSDYGKKIAEISPNPHPADTMDADFTEYLSKFTIEGMFAQVERLLKEEEDYAQNPAAYDTGGYMANEIRFDPVLAYPKRVNEQPVGEMPSDVDWDETVTDLKIIKQNK